ncbi:NUDIX domain-containing protein [Patescibacteria group bacterium]|nr:MAG: NUDIX domain-containing protein [Patescibacteria group bacterium]
MPQPIDYTHARSAPVLAIYVKYKDKFLIVKRSDKHLTYQGLWSCVAGFVDDEKTMEDKVEFEMEEELGLKKSDVKSIKKGETYLFVDKDLDREWIRHLFLVEITSPNIKLNWEHSEYVWIDPKDTKDYQTTPGFEKDLAGVLKLK